MKSVLSRSKNLRTARLQVESLESRVQPSFLTGGFDLGFDLGDDLFSDHHHNQLTALTSALAAQPSTTALSSGVSAASNSGPAASPAPTGSSAGAELSAAARSLGATFATIGTNVNPHSQHGPTAVATNSNQVAPISITDVRNLATPAQVNATIVHPTAGGVGTNAVVWAGYLGDPNLAVWNDVVTGTGASAGDVFYVGTSTDANGNAAATVMRIQADGTPGPTSYIATLAFSFSTFTQPDSINHAVLNTAGDTLYLTGSFSDSTAPTLGYDGPVIMADATTLAGNAVVFPDATTNGITLFANGDVGVTGKTNNPASPNQTDILLARFNSSLSLPPVFAETLQFAGNSAGLGASSDSSGNMYVSGWIQNTPDNNAAFGSVDATGTVRWSGQFFFFANVTPGTNGAMKSVTESGGFVYGVGTLNNGMSTGPYSTDMIIFKADDATGSLTTGGYGWDWHNTDAAGNPSGDINAMAGIVRGGRQYISGGNYDTAPDPGEPIKSAFLFQMTATGDNVLANWFGGPSTTTQDIAMGIAFATNSGTDVFWGGSTTSTDLPVTNGSTFGGGTTDAWSSRWVIA
jgi:hypothetical protein